MVLQYKKIGPWKDYLFGERFYIILSLSAKTVLACDASSQAIKRAQEKYVVPNLFCRNPNITCFFKSRISRATLWRNNN